MKLITRSIFTIGLIAINCLFSSVLCECDNSTPSKSSEILEEYVIDLNLQPELRWKELLTEKSEALKIIFDDIQELVQFLIGERLSKLIDNELPKIAAMLPYPYNKEIEGMSAASGLPVGHLTMYNIFYELFVFCTSVIVEDADGNIHHGRNLDNGALLGWDIRNHTWKVTEMMRPLTVLLHWKRGNESLFKSVSFAGYIGILTAVKENKFSFSLDKRMALNNGVIGLLEWMLLKDHNQSWVTFHAREVVTSAKDYEDAKMLLSKARLIAPVYYILSGVNPKEGVIITRDRDNANLLELGSKKTGQGSWFLVETNYDHWKSPPFFDDRRTPSIKCLMAGGQEKADWMLIYNVLSTKPVLNKSTIYTAIMQTKNGTMRAWLQDCPSPCSPW